MAQYKMRVASTGYHHTYGWLRRPDKDEPFQFAYEHPNGRMIYSSNPMHQQRARIWHLIDVDTGEEYLTLDEAAIETTEKRPEGR
jgi:hypothetical protein